MFLWRAYPRGSEMVSRLPQDSRRPKRSAWRAPRHVPEDDVGTAGGSSCSESPAGSLEMASRPAQLRARCETRSHSCHRRDHCARCEVLRLLLGGTVDHRHRAVDAINLDARARSLNSQRRASPRRTAPACFAISRVASRLAIASRLSHFLRPFARASSTFTLFPLK